MAPGDGSAGREPNVHVKVSEFGLKDRPGSTGEPTVVLDALAIFGVERHVCDQLSGRRMRIGYGDLVAAMRRMLDHLSPNSATGSFWQNAKAFYRL